MYNIIAEHWIYKLMKNVILTRLKMEKSIFSVNAYTFKVKIFILQNCTHIIPQ